MVKCTFFRTQRIPRSSSIVEVSAIFILTVFSVTSYVFSNVVLLIRTFSRICWPRGLRRRYAAAPFLGLRVRGPPGEWIYVSCECCVLPGRGLCHVPITRPGFLPSVVCTSVIEEPHRGGLGPLGLSSLKKIECSRLFSDKC